MGIMSNKDKQKLPKNSGEKHNIKIDYKKLLKLNGPFYDGTWHCTQCGTDMGPQNPRQLCGKTYCHEDFS